MLKSVLGAAAAAALLVAAGCTQGENEEAGEAADTAYEQSTQGQTDPGQGPMEEAGEQADETTEGQPSGDTTTPQPPPSYP